MRKNDAKEATSQTIPQLQYKAKTRHSSFSSAIGFSTRRANRMKFLNPLNFWSRTLQEDRSVLYLHLVRREPAKHTHSKVVTEGMELYSRQSGT